MSRQTVKISVTGVKANTIRNSAHTWFVGVRVCKRDDFSADVYINPETNPSFAQKFVKHMIVRKGGTVSVNQ